MNKKFYFTICNYNAQLQNGALEKSLAALARIKTADVAVAMFDNMSKDGSVEVINRFYAAGTIDHAMLSGKNYGKAFAMNRLYEYLRRAYRIFDDDIIVNMDSDIIIDYPDFFNNVAAAFQQGNVGYIGYNFWRDDQKTDRDVYNNRQIYSGIVEINGVKYGKISSGSGMAGGLLCIRNALFSKIGYDETLGNNGAPAIYGGDDAMLTLRMFRSGYAGLFDIDSPIIHYSTENKEYQKWKENTNNNMCYNGFRNPTLPVKGFYD